LSSPWDPNATGVEAPTVQVAAIVMLTPMVPVAVAADAPPARARRAAAPHMEPSMRARVDMEVLLWVAKKGLNRSRSLAVQAGVGSIDAEALMATDGGMAALRAAMSAVAIGVLAAPGCAGAAVANARLPVSLIVRASCVVTTAGAAAAPRCSAGVPFRISVSAGPSGKREVLTIAF
jgi:hypothetical protein